MSRTVSPSSNRPYGVARVVTVWDLARSSFYAARQRQLQPREPARRGPKVYSDEELVSEIRKLLAEPVFTGEGYRKIWARLRHLAGCGKTPISSAICNSHYVELNGEAINSSWHQAKCV